jgi:4-aminobutyrate aminotransferase
MDLIQRAKKVMSPVQGHYTELQVKKGKGSYLYTTDGKKVLDFACGVAVTSLGHAHPGVNRAAKKQLDLITHNCAGVSYVEPGIALMEELAGELPEGLSHFWFCQSGTEVIEAAIKCARYTTKRKKVIALEGGFHGRTFGAMTLTSSNPEKYSKPYEPLVPDLLIVPRDINEIKKINLKEVAGILTELVTGEGGYVVQDKKFIQELKKLCEENGAYLILDEIQTGFGRTGTLFAFEQFGVVPDLLCLGKAIANGLPLGALAMKKNISEKWTVSTHGGTFTGNLVSCAAARVSLKEVKKLIPSLSQKSKLFFEKLNALHKKYPQHLVEVRGLGLMIGVEFKSGDLATRFKNLALAKGLLLITCGKDRETIRIIPPLNVSENEIKTGLHIIESALSEL